MQVAVFQGSTSPISGERLWRSRSPVRRRILSCWARPRALRPSAPGTSARLPRCAPPGSAGGQFFSCDSSMRNFYFRFFGCPTLPAFGRVGVLTSFPEKSNPPAPRKPRGIGHPQLHPRLKGPATRDACNQPSPAGDRSFLACSRICRIPTGATRRIASARTAETFSATATLMNWFRDTPSDLAALRASAITEACSLRG